MYPKRDSNSHDRSHWFLRPTRLPLRHRGIDHIRQAFYSQLRGIVSNLAHLTAVWVPEDMIFVIRKGFEPLTPNLEGLCSIQLSYRTN